MLTKRRPKGYAERYALAYAKRLALEWGYPLGLASRRARGVQAFEETSKDSPLPRDRIN